MEILTKRLFRCDVCGHESEWVFDKWWAHIFILDAKTGNEFEFHACSDLCDSKLCDMTRKQRIELQRKIISNIV